MVRASSLGFWPVEVLQDERVERRESVRLRVREQRARIGEQRPIAGRRRIDADPEEVDEVRVGRPEGGKKTKRMSLSASNPPMSKEAAESSSSEISGSGSAPEGR
jgi:hypothetical protein